MEISCPKCEHPNPKDAKFCKECGLQLARSSDPLIGRKIGNHRLVKRIGVGGMGVVYLAEHVNLGKQYAVKFLHPQFASDEEVVERFRREAQVIAALDHENIIRENDFGWLDGVGFYLIMEYLVGETLKERIKNRGPLPIEEVIVIFEQLMDALDEAHSQGVIHRDLKPENIFLVKRRGREQLKILDFGIARVVLDGGNKDFTVDGEVYGSPTYMSPEQARGEISKVDHRADLYAVGIILVELLTGRPPYKGATPAEVMLAHISALPPHLSDLNPELRYAAGLGDFIFKALAKEPDERFQSASDFWKTLLPMLEKTGELRTEIDETVDIPAAPRPILPVSSSARVLVSREWTPSPSTPPMVDEKDIPLAPSQPSLPSSVPQVAVSAVDGRDMPSPTSEMKGFSGGGQSVYETQEHMEAPQGHQTGEAFAFLSEDSQPPIPPTVLSPNTPSSLFPPQSGGAVEYAPSYDSLVGVMSSFDEDDDDEEATTVSLVSSSNAPETPTPPDSFAGASPSTVAVSPDMFAIDSLAPDEKTRAVGLSSGRTVSSVSQDISSASLPVQDVPSISTSQPSVASQPPPVQPNFMNQTQSEVIKLPRSTMEIVIKHPAFLGGVVGFVLLLLIWALLPGSGGKKNTVLDAGEPAVRVIRNVQPPPLPRQGSVVPRQRVQIRQPVSVKRQKEPSKVRQRKPSKVTTTSLESIHLEISSVPSGATVIIQGRGEVGKTPTTIQSPKGSYIRIYIQKEGFQSKMMPWRAEKNTKQVIHLVPE